MAGEDDLICDFAEVYQGFDWRQMPVKLAATLAAGLPDDSRSKRALIGMPYGLDTLLLAAIVDRLSLLVWTKTKDAQKGRNRPQMITDGLLQNTENKDIEAFKDVDSFEAARRRFLKE